MQLTEEHLDRVKIANLVVWLQMAVFAADETAHIKWFNRHKTKNVLNNFNDIVIKEHGPLLKSFWDIPDQIDMVEMSNRLSKFAALITDMDYEDMQESIELIEKYLKEKRNGNSN
jgi:hypothetical protein